MFLWLKSVIEETDTTAGRAFDLTIQFLIVVSLVSFCIETLPGLSEDTINVLQVVEATTVVMFSAEYILRLVVADKKLRFVFSFYGLIDLFAVLPFWVVRGVDLRAIRVFRFLRLFRIFKVLRFTQAIRRFAVAFRMVKAELMIFIAATVFLLFVSAVGIYYFENDAQPEAFSSIFDSLWWAVATLTTVGYGDMFPITVGGKIFTSFVSLIGIGVVAVPSGILASALTKAAQDESPKK